MKRNNSLRFALLSTAALLLTPAVFAHCDGLDGPVVAAARKALETGNVKLVLPWIKQAGEGEIAKAFDQARSVRTQGGAARELADRYFFETVVRVHREGEGAPYTGLKPAGRDLGQAIPAADKALAGGSSEALANLLAERVRHAVTASFETLKHNANYRPDDVEAGRRFVAAYVEFLHLAERIEAAAGPAHSHEH